MLVYAALMAADGFGWGVATTVLLAVVMTVTPSTMSSAVAMGWYVGFQGIALALATTVAGLLAQSFGTQTAMILLATIPVVAAILISLRLPHRDVELPAERTVTVDDGQDEDLSAPGRFRWIRGGASAAKRIIRGLPAAVWAAAIVAVYLNVMNGLLQSFFPLLGIAAGHDARAGGHAVHDPRRGVVGGPVRGGRDLRGRQAQVPALAAADRVRVHRDGAALDGGLVPR